MEKADKNESDTRHPDNDSVYGELESKLGNNDGDHFTLIIVENKFHATLNGEDKGVVNFDQNMQEAVKRLRFEDLKSTYKTQFTEWHKENEPLRKERYHFGEKNVDNAAALAAMEKIATETNFTIDPLSEETTDWIRKTFKKFFMDIHEGFECLGNIQDDEIKKIPLRERWRLCIDPAAVDLIERSPLKGKICHLMPLLFDKDKDNYFYKMAYGWQEAMGSVSNRVTSDSLQILNKQCSKAVRGEFGSVKYGVNHNQSLTKEGLIDLKILAELIPVCQNVRVNDENMLYEGIASRLRAQGENVNKKVIFICKKENQYFIYGKEASEHALKLSDAETRIAEKLPRLLQVEKKESGHYQVIRRKISNDIMHGFLDQELSNYYKHTSSNVDDQKKRQLTLIQSIERFHPFSDGNIRTCLLTLNRIRRADNMPLLIFRNPNVLDGFSIDELATRRDLVMDVSLLTERKRSPDTAWEHDAEERSFKRPRLEASKDAQTLQR